MARAAVLAIATATCLAAQSGRVALIPEGTFEMGRSYTLPDDGLKWVPHTLRDDRPVHAVWLPDFEIDVHEVTNRQYAEYVERSGGEVDPPFYWGGPQPRTELLDEPVANVTWQDARDYCAWRGMRLPTEAEWEKACRGGLPARKYPWGDAEIDRKLAHYDSVNGPVPVCSFEPNGYGLCDMAGNAWEWIADFYAKDYYAGSPSRTPPGAATGRYKVLRGGSWSDVPKFLTCGHRSFARPAERSPNIGFRCARAVR